LSYPELAHRITLVTGGTRGVGRAIADAFLSQGAVVVVCGRSDPEPETSRRNGPAPHFMAADVRNAAQASALLADIVSRFGRLDVLVNNAGGSPPSETATASPRFFDAIVQLNLVAPLRLSALANDIMQAQEDGGTIINIGSLSGLRPSPSAAAYGAAKAGIINATSILAAEFAPKVRVNCVTPGAIATPELHKLYGGDTYFDRLAASVPLGRIGRPEDVAGACLFFASAASAFITGANLLVHGGGEDPPET
jgi:NAD(P)-dependent dehydrogenase (short-subunit alcohol dehydrogenase family)